MKGYLDTPCGKFPRMTNLDHLSDIEVIEEFLATNERTGFVDPEMVQEMKDRKMPEIAMNTYEIRKSLAKRKEQLIKDLLKDNAVLKIALFKHIQENCDCNGMPPCALCRSEFDCAIQQAEKELEEG